MSAPTGAPCVAWVSVDEVAACCSADVGSDTALFEAAAIAASEALFELSGRQWTGACVIEDARPFASGCGCWDWITSPMSSGAPQIPWGSFGWGSYAGIWGWGWDGCSGVMGCGSLSRAILTGYPVVSIEEVKIDGVVIDPSEYRLDEWRFLTRMADPTTREPRFWPACQRLDLDGDQPGTWTVSYTSGTAPPSLGVQAAAQLACQVYLACTGSADCVLPSGVTKIDRQGITIERAPFLAWGKINGQWASGLSLVDLFLSSFNPQGLRRRTAVWNPDGPAFSVQLGS